LSWIFVCFRLYVRWRVVKMTGLDDLFVLLYLVGCPNIMNQLREHD